MEAADKAALLEAVNVLITAPNAHDLFEALTTVSGVASRVGISLTGAAAPLNPLLKLHSADRGAYDRVLNLVEQRRADMGYDPLVKPKKEGYDKTTYMREFMDQKRERQRLAATIENLRRPERDKLMGNARLEFMRRQSERWKELRDQALAAAREQAGGSLSAALRTETLDAFWKAVDDDLEAKHEAAKRAALNPSRRAPEEDMTDLLAALKLPGRDK